MEDGPHKQLFEYQQELLERNTEKVSEFTENLKIDSVNRDEIIRMTRLSMKFLHDMLESMRNRGQTNEQLLEKAMSSATSASLAPSISDTKDSQVDMVDDIELQLALEASLAETAQNIKRSRKY
jgi:hypothetical protein